LELHVCHICTHTHALCFARSCTLSCDVDVR
jgi:hypothetical protein